MTIRSFEDKDAGEVVALLAQLGYDRTSVFVRGQVRSLNETGDFAVLVAEDDGGLAGLIEVHRERSFIDGDRGLIGALVVSSHCLRSGVGRRLVSEAEHWASANGLTKIRVGTNMTRTEAHKFYEALGFGLNKRHHIYEKSLSS